MATPRELLDIYGALSLHSANEADTRLKLIDQIVFGVLEWTHDDVSVEVRSSEDGTTTFADYVLSTAMTSLVVEAKRIGATFDDLPNQRRVLIRRLLRTNIGEYLIQARDYARRLSIPFASVTNGAQWVIFPATRVDEIPFEQSSAIIFPSLRSCLEDDYQEFSDLLSRAAVVSGSLENELLGRLEDQLIERRLNRYYESSPTKGSGSELYALIEPAVVAAFTEEAVRHNAELLQKCYVPSADRMRFDRRIRMRITQRTAPVTGAVRPLRNERSGYLSGIIRSAASESRPLALLVLGPVGAGKTTFIDYTRDVAAASLFAPTGERPYPHWIYIDLRSLGPDSSPVDFIYARLRDYIDAERYLSDYDRCIQHAYGEQIAALFRGPLHLLAGDEGERRRRISELLMSDYNKVVPYVDVVLRYAARNTSVFIVIDNVDQFDSVDFQEKLFGEAMALARRIGVGLVLALREATYVRHRNLPVFDAFDFDAIAIDPPPVKAVLSRRFFVAEGLLNGVSGDFVAENGAKMHVENLADVIGILRNSVLGTEIGNLIEVFATGDIRNALRMTREFLRHGYTAPARALQVHARGRKYVMPRHEALRAIMLGSRRVYHEEYSSVGNIFDSRVSLTSAQMLRMFLMNGIVTAASAGSFRGVQGTAIQEIGRSIGFGEEIVMRVLTDLSELRFLFTESHTDPSFQATYVPSRLGGYIIRELCSDVMYIENTMYDTFIADEGIWETLRETTDAIHAERDVVSRVKLRMARVRLFYQHMKASAQHLADEAVRRWLANEWVTNPLTVNEDRFESNVRWVIESAQRNYGTNGRWTGREATREGTQPDIS